MCLNQYVAGTIRRGGVDVGARAAAVLVAFDRRHRGVDRGIHRQCAGDADIVGTGTTLGVRAEFTGLVCRGRTTGRHDCHHGLYRDALGIDVGVVADHCDIGADAEVERDRRANTHIGVAAIDLATVGLGLGIGLRCALDLERAARAADLLALGNARRGGVDADVYANCRRDADAATFAGAVVVFLVRGRRRFGVRQFGRGAAAARRRRRRGLGRRVLARRRGLGLLSGNLLINALPASRTATRRRRGAVCLGLFSSSNAGRGTGAAPGNRLGVNVNAVRRRYIPVNLGHDGVSRHRQSNRGAYRDAVALCLARRRGAGAAGLFCRAAVFAAKTNVRRRFSEPRYRGVHRDRRRHQWRHRDTGARRAARDVRRQAVVAGGIQTQIVAARQYRFVRNFGNRGIDADVHANRGANPDLGRAARAGDLGARIHRAGAGIGRFHQDVARARIDCRARAVTVYITFERGNRGVDPDTRRQ